MQNKSKWDSSLQSDWKIFKNFITHEVGRHQRICTLPVGPSTDKLEMSIKIVSIHILGTSWYTLGNLFYRYFLCTKNYALGYTLPHYSNIKVKIM